MGLGNMFRKQLLPIRVFATNGGPFSYPGPFGTSKGCSGVMISENETLASDYAYGGTQFGVTSSGQWFLGNLKSPGDASKLRITNLVSGFNWIVYNSTSTVGAKGANKRPEPRSGWTDKGA